MQPTKTLIRLRRCTGWFESSLSAFWTAKDAKFLHLDNEDSDQTVPICRLIRVFIGCTCQEICFLTLWLICFCVEIRKLSPIFGWNIAPYQELLWSIGWHTVNVLKFPTFYSILFCLNFASNAVVSQNIWWNGKQCRPWSDCSFRSNLIWVCTVCICHFVWHFDIRNFRTFIVLIFTGDLAYTLNQGQRDLHVERTILHVLYVTLQSAILHHVPLSGDILLTEKLLGSKPTTSN